MPIYEYKCQTCANEFEVFLLPRELNSAPEFTCPACQGSDIKRRVTAIAVATKESTERNWNRARQRFLSGENRDREMDEKRYVERFTREESDYDPDPRSWAEDAKKSQSEN